MSISVGSLILIAGSVDNPSLNFNGYTTTGFYSGDSTSMSLSIAGTKEVTFADGLGIKQFSIINVSSADSGYYKVFCDTTGNLQGIDSNGNVAYAGLLLSKLPTSNFSNFSITGLQKYISSISYCNNPIITTFIANAVAYSELAEYKGAVYSPTQNRVYLIPGTQTIYKIWHYLDCVTNLFVPYFCTVDGTDPGGTDNPYRAGSNTYTGGCYCPTQNRIYPIPSVQTTTQTIFQYIDCNTGFVGIYTGIALNRFYTYKGGVYSPTQNRIYCVPNTSVFDGPPPTTWQYIDCNTTTVVSYPAIADTYANGGCYSPGENRIYFTSSPSLDHGGYIDCATGLTGTYSWGSIPATVGYSGAAYSPIQNRIYMAPNVQDATLVPNWHYIDCYTGEIVAYPTTIDLPSYYFSSCVYDPLHNIILFIPTSSLQTALNWFYIDCKDNTVKSFVNTTSVTSINYLFSGLFIPSTGRTLFVPQLIIPGNSYIYISDLDSTEDSVSSMLMSGAIFNKL